jgi:hypothetical protein
MGLPLDALFRGWCLLYARIARPGNAVIADRLAFAVSGILMHKK